MHTGLRGCLVATLTVSLSVPLVAHAQDAIPRTADGKPDLSGIWQAVNTAAWDLQDHSGRLGVPAGRGVVEGNEIPYQPWALKKKQENFANRATADPEAKCYLPGRAARHLHAVPVSDPAEPDRMW